MKPSIKHYYMQFVRRRSIVAFAIGAALFSSTFILGVAAFAQQKEQPPVAATLSNSTVRSVESSNETELVNKRVVPILSENGQFTFIPAQINKSDLRNNLHYPAQALTEGREGQVDVVVYLNAEGGVMGINFAHDVQISENEFAAAAFDAVKKCRFTPAYRDNKPVNSIVQIPVRFVQ